jgi:hypothetical protein
MALDAAETAEAYLSLATLDKDSPTPCSVPKMTLLAAERALSYCSLAREVTDSTLP